MVTSILRMALPVLLTFAVGYLCKRLHVFSTEGLRALKAVVGNVTLPAVLFYAFWTAEYSAKIALTFTTVFVACGLGLLAGFALRRVAAPYGKFMPFLTTNFEGGMLGYSLFGLLYVGQTQIFAMADIGQTVFAFTVFLTTLRAVSGKRAGAKALAGEMLRNPVLIAIVLGVLLGVSGVGRSLLATDAGLVLSDVVRFIAAPTSALILLIVGYELNFRRSMMRPVLATVGLRLVIMGALFGLSALVLFSLIPFDKPLFVALLLAFSLPAPYIIPLYAEAEDHAAYLSATLSAQTLVSLALFIAIAAYTLA